MNPQEQTRRRCECGVGWVLTGHFAKHNAKDESGKQVCPDCIIKQTYDNFFKNRNQGDTHESF